MGEDISKINLIPLKSVITWETNRILTYFKTINDYLLYLKKNANKKEFACLKIENYIKEIEKILSKRQLIN